jgi:ubiquinol-cytochrome c reductase cytochrome b subunit
MKKRLHTLFRAIPQRLGWKEGIGPFLLKELPPGTGWSATLGSLCVMLFGIMFVTGVFLAMHYNPSPDKAYSAIDYIMNEVPWGWLLRGLHHWGASVMVIAVFLHMMTSFFAGSYKKPREFTWLSGVVMLLIVLGLGFTGYLLPWDLKAYWATTVSTNIPKDIPVVGQFLSKIALGGDSISGATLTRFYAVHAMLLPALLVGFIAFHIYLVRAHGIAEPTVDTNGTPKDDTTPAKKYRFYPEHLWRATIVFLVAFAVLLGLSIFAHIPREQIAGTQVDNYLPRPEWYYMWLFQLLTLFPGRFEWVGSLVVPFVLLALLFALPFLGRRSTYLGVKQRPLPLAVGTTMIVGLVYLTCMGFAGAKPYGEIIPVPDRPLSATESRGLYLYADRQCAYCHQIDGKGGHRVGPDLSNMVAKRRSKDYLKQYIHDPQSMNRTSIMPKYDLPDADLAALADFLQSLDFGKYDQKTVTRDEALKLGVK